MLTELEKRYDWRVEWGDMPGLNTILDEWLTTVEAAEIMKITPDHLSHKCGERKVKSIKINGRWKVDPQFASKYQKGKWSHL